MTDGCRTVDYPTDKMKNFTFDLIVEVLQGYLVVLQGEIFIECSDIVTFTKVPDVTVFVFNKTELGSESIHNITYELSSFNTNEIHCPVDKFIFEDLTAGKSKLNQPDCLT